MKIFDNEFLRKVEEIYVCVCVLESIAKDLSKSVTMATELVDLSIQPQINHNGKENKERMHAYA